MLKMSGRRRKGRPLGRFMDGVREDMQRVGVRGGNLRDKVRWRKMI